jgi:SWIM zinc finger
MSGSLPESWHEIACASEGDVGLAKRADIVQGDARAAFPMSAVSHTYRYLEPSTLSEGAAPKLSLATSSQADSHPYFFEGSARRPQLVAQLLTAVHLIVGSRFFTPANSVARAVMLADPIVTAGGGCLRFEGFSSCGSTYARADLLPEGYDGELVGKGTTNVDFNAPMRAALARVRDAAGLALAIGRDELSLRSGAARVTERKVELPTRWLRALVEVQACQAAMQPRLEVTGTEALRLLRTLPKASTARTPLWLARGATGLHTTTRPVDGGVRFTDTTRLRVLQGLLAHVRSLAVHADDAQQASAWVLDFEGARLTLALSAEVWRGFSGEGQALRALMLASGERIALALSAVRAALHWQAAIDAPALARELRLEVDAVSDALRVLGASGVVGYDVVERRYFHRELPFDLSMLEDLHPRLADARALVDAGAVTVLGRAPFEASVASGGVAHRVRIERGERGDWRCTCPWFAKHQGQRGPCKHVLAAEACIEGPT